MKPVVLLIPGMLNTAAVWGRVAPLLTPHAEVRIADVQTQSSIADMARDAVAQVADLTPNRSLVLCGFSMGGYVAMELIANYVEFISTRRLSLAFLDTSARPESPEGAVMRDKTAAAMAKDFGRVVDGVAQFGTDAAAQADAQFMAGMRQIMLGIGTEAAIQQCRAIKVRGDYRAELAKLAFPTLVMCGRADRITPPEHSEELASIIPGARLEWIERAGHMTPLEQPQRVAKLLQSLL